MTTFDHGPGTDVRHIDLASRISARAIASGTLVSLAVLALLVSIAGAFGAAGPLRDPATIDGLGAGVYVWAAVAWIVAAFAGAFVAGSVGRARSRRDGTLYGLVAWAAACITGAALLCGDATVTAQTPPVHA